MLVKVTEERARKLYGVSKENIMKGIDDGTFKGGQKIGDRYMMEVQGDTDDVNVTQPEYSENKEAIKVVTLEDYNLLMNSYEMKKDEIKILKEIILVVQAKFELYQEISLGKRDVTGLDDEMISFLIDKKVKEKMVVS